MDTKAKHFVVANLFALVLLALVSVPIAHQQSGGSYDPWLDYNEDGKIDVNELHPLGQAYGTSGDPTKNVTITRLASKLCYKADVGVPGLAHWWSGDYTSVDGYSKVTVLVQFGAVTNNYTLRVCDDTLFPEWIIDHVDNFSFNLVKTYDVQNQRIGIQIWNGDVDTRHLLVDIYVVP